MIDTDDLDNMSRRDLVELLEAYNESLAEVKQLREENDRLMKECGALWGITDNWDMCEDDYTMHDLYKNLDERYAWDDDVYGNRIILKELYTYTEEDGWIRKEEEE